MEHLSFKEVEYNVIDLEMWDGEEWVPWEDSEGDSIDQYDYDPEVGMLVKSGTEWYIDRDGNMKKRKFKSPTKPYPISYDEGED